MSPDAGDGSPSPEPGTDLESGIMAEEKIERPSSEEKSPSQGASGNSQPSKSSAKDPSRPRRKKARRACFACQRAHLTCGKDQAHRHTGADHANDAQIANAPLQATNDHA